MDPYAGKPLLSLDAQQKLLYNLIREKGPITRGQLQRLTGIKATTLNRWLDDMQRSGLIRRRGLAQPTGGRPSVLFAIEPEAAYVAGVDISRTSVSMALFDLDMKAIQRESISMDASSVPDKVLGCIAQWLQQALLRNRISADRLLGISVGAVGPIDGERGVMMHPQGFAASSWDEVRVKDELQKIIGTEVMLVNGADGGALAEWRYGAGRGYGKMLYVIAGVGLRCSLVANGRVIRGVDDDEAVLGHMVVDIDGRICRCGKRGCVEAYFSVPALASDLRCAAAVDDVAAALAADSAAARCIIDDAARHMAVGLANLAGVLRPDAIILTGSLMRLIPMLYDATVKYAQGYMNSCRYGGKLVFSPGQLGQDAIALGAALMMIDNILNKEAGGIYCW